MNIFRIALIALMLGQPAWAATPQALLQKAANAIGAVPTQGLEVMGRMTYYDPEQSPVPGGEPRLGAETGFTQWRDATGTRSRIEWKINALRPVPRQLRYVEVVEGHTGYVIGSDSALLTKQAQAGVHAMSRTRAALNARELVRTSPGLVRQMLREPARVKAAPAFAAGGRTLSAVRYASDVGDMQVGFDPVTGLPAAIRMLDYDPIQGDSNFDLVLGDWRRAGAMQYPFRQRYELNGKSVAAVDITSVEAKTPPAGAWDRPANAGAAADAASGDPATDSFQWFFRKQGFAVLMDSDHIFYDAQQQEGLAFTPLAPSIWMVTGGFYNSVLVELDDALVVYDAPHEVMSQAILRETAQRFPGKPIRDVIVTHYHMDHAGGLRSYVAAGATLVVGKGGVKDFLTTALRRPATLGIAELQTAQARAALQAPKIVEVDGPFSVGSGAIQAQAYPVVPNEHAVGMLFGYMPSAKLGFVSDLWSPGRAGPPPPPGTEQRENLLALVRSVRLWKLQPEQFAGGHGRVGNYAPVDALLPQEAAP